MYNKMTKSNTNAITVPPNVSVERLGNITLNGATTFQDDATFDSLNVKQTALLAGALTGQDATLNELVSLVPQLIVSKNTFQFLTHGTETRISNVATAPISISGGIGDNSGGAPANYRITVSDSGVYELGYNMYFTNAISPTTNVATNLNIGYAINTGARQRWGDHSLSGEYFKYNQLMLIRTSGYTKIFLNAGDYIEFPIFHFTSNGSNIALENASRIWIRKQM